MPTAQEVYEIQSSYTRAWEDRYAISEDIYWSLPPTQRHRAEEHPDVLAAQKAVDAIHAKMVEGQNSLGGGRVFRVPAENYDKLERKIHSLAKRAIKLGVEPVSIKTHGQEEEEYKGDLLTWLYVTIKGEAPKVPGYVFLASLDHTVQSKDQKAVLINRVPGTEEYANLDLEGYRHAENRCDHCNMVRPRNATYVVLEEATGEMKQVGRQCLADYTGSRNPEKIAAYAEYLIELEEELDEGGESENYGGHARKIIPTLTFVTHCATMIRANGSYQNGSASNPTKNAAMENIQKYGKSYKGKPVYVEITDADKELAEKAVTWIREKDVRFNEFETNMKIMAMNDNIPEKGHGYLAYIVPAYTREQEQKVEKEAKEKIEKAQEAEMLDASKAEPIKAGRYEISGTVLRIYEKTTDFGTVLKMTVLDDRGFKVNGSVPKDIDGHMMTVRFSDGTERTLTGLALAYRAQEYGEEGEIINRHQAQEGDHVTFKATVKVAEDKDQYGWYTRPFGGKIDKEVAA